MSKFKRVENGLFEIVSFYHTSYTTKVKLKKNGEIFLVYLKSIEKFIIGKTHLDLTLYLTQSNNWVVGPATNKITVKQCKECGKEFKNNQWHCCGKYNYKWITRDKRVIEDCFMPYRQESRGRARPKIYMTAQTTGEEVRCHLHDIFPHLDKIYSGKPIKLREQSKSGVFVWVPIE